MDPISIQMKRGKETAKSWRYEATDEDVTPDNVYIRKVTLAEMGDPEVITVTITPSA